MEEENGRKGQGLLEAFGRLLNRKKRVTEAEIQEMMDAGEEEGLINEEENAMIRSILALGDSVVREIMLPRTQMACVSIEAEVSEVLQAIIACGHSRLPVYEGTIDNIIGLIYAKDLLKYWGALDAAVAFSIATSVSFRTQDPLISLLCFILAVMVSHSRLLLHIHSMREVIIGALTGTLLTVAVTGVFRALG